MVSSSLQSLPSMMRRTPVVAPVSAPDVRPKETKTISAELGSFGRSPTSGELATKLLVSSVHSHCTWGEKTPITAAPLQAAPGGASLRQSAPQQYVSPWQSLAVAQAAPALPHLLAVVQMYPSMQVPPGPQSPGVGSSFTATPAAPPAPVWPAAGPVPPLEPAKPRMLPPLPPPPLLPGCLTRAQAPSAPRTSRT